MHLNRIIYRLVELDRGRKPPSFKDQGRFSGTPYRVCLYSTTKYGFDIDVRFIVGFNDR